MKPHPRIRKFFKWGGAAVCAVLVVLWVGSGFGFASLAVSRDLRLLLHTGHIVADIGLGMRPDWHPRVGKYADSDFHMGWLPGGASYPGYRSLWVPLWMPFVVVAASTALAWRLDTLARRRAIIGACPKCSYSRTGLAPDAVCPECGAPATPL